MVGATGFEPATLCTPCRCATRLRHAPNASILRAAVIKGEILHAKVPLIFQLLQCPMLDNRTCTMSDPHAFTGKLLWKPASNRFGWSALLGIAPGGGNDVSPYAAAARAENLAGLPPTFISVGAVDLFLEEVIEYARRLTRAGVPVELHVYPGGFHGFESVPDAQVSIRGRRESLSVLKRLLNPCDSNSVELDA